MRLYQTQKGTWAGTQSDAGLAALDDGSGKGNWTQIEVLTDKLGLLTFLNERCGVKPSPLDALTTAPLPHAGIDEPLMTEDRFEALSLPVQLHLAALAVENARTAIRPQAEAQRAGAAGSE